MHTYTHTHIKFKSYLYLFISSHLVGSFLRASCEPDSLWPLSNNKNNNNNRNRVHTQRLS